VAPAPASARDFATLPAARELAQARELGSRFGLANPYFQAHAGVAAAAPASARAS
jgi:hypothetical protein